ncbi:MAG: glucarate dehydratase [Spirochaetales bacterium]|jgi:glucarate dehydratase|nr:glucarate dehydratase [Spirochaetales bacterium]
MIITELIITPIAVCDPPLLNAAGIHAAYALRIILEIQTNNGLTGISEIPGSEKTHQALENIALNIIGSDPFNLNKIQIAIENSLGTPEETRGGKPWDSRTIVHIKSAVEVACLDLIGKAIDRPVSDLLGGAVRDKVPFAAYLFFKREGAGGQLGFGTKPKAVGWDLARQQEALNPAQIVAQAEVMCREYGYQSIKLKGGVLHPDIEVESILALREAFGPNIPLRLDPNAVWSYETALAAAAKLKGVLEYYEDPVRGQKDMARLKENCGIPLATNMCTTSFEDLPGSIMEVSEDIILSDHHFWGGLRASVELSRICRTFGRGLSMHSNSHLGISLAAMVHLGSVIPEIPYALDTHYPWQSEEVVLGGKIPIEDGFIQVPKGPGLGVEIDRKALETLNSLYLECGLKERNDEIEMKKIDPDWEFKTVRW